MKRFIKMVIYIFLAFAIILGALALWKREEVGRLGAVLSLFSEEKIVANFSDMRAAFLTRELPQSDVGQTSDLRRTNVGLLTDLPPQVDAWIAERDVTALVILKDGALVYEDYFKGTAARDVRINWSVSKSYLSALMGVLLDEGAIGSIDDSVVQYAPALGDSAYATATIKDVLQMSSGVTFNENYLSFFSDINRMGRVLALGGSMDAFAAKQDASFAAPGAGWQYVSIDTHVIGMVIRGATGRDIPDLLNEKIIGPMGFEVDPYFLTDGYGVAFVLGGLNTTTRDNARFGQMIANGGQWNGQQIIPADWVDASTVASAKTAPGEIGYGYQWWIPVGAVDGQFMARGIYGQYIYIDRINDVVISVHSADRAFRDEGVNAQNEAMFRLIAESME